MTHASRIAMFAATALLVAACGADDAVGTADGDATTSIPDTTSSTTTTTFPVTLVPSTTKTPSVPTTAPPVRDFAPGDDQVVFAVADLAIRLGVDEAVVVVVEQTEVIWNDGSLGCPQPGMSYTQALVDGVQIILEVDGVQYDYHARAGRAPFLCENAGSTDKSG